MLDFFQSSDGVTRLDDLRQLLEMRAEAVARYKFFTPDAAYPVYVCGSCGTKQVSLSLVSPELWHYDSFTGYLAAVSDMVGALPLAPCDGCGGGTPAAPTWVALFTYFAPTGDDVFLKLQDGTVTEALRIPPLGDAEALGPLADDAAFLEALGRPFSHRWATRHLIEGFRDRPGLHVKQVDAGWFLGVDTSPTPAPEAWAGWFADRAPEEELDTIVLLSSAAREGYVDDTPVTWLSPRDARALTSGRLGLAVFLSAGRLRRHLEDTLMQRGITVSGVDDPLTLTLEGYSCPIPFMSLLRKAAFTGYPPDRVLRQHLLKRLDHLEALRSVGDRLRHSFEEEYVVELREGCLMVVTDYESGSTLREIELAEVTELGDADDETYAKALADLFGFDTATRRFTSGT